MKQKLRYLPLLILVAVFVVLLDQWTKSLVRQAIPVGNSIIPFKFIGPFFRILHWHNTGAAFGLFQDANLILMIAAVIIIITLIWYFLTLNGKNMLVRYGLALAVGGAFGNLIDRVKQGFVTDFISVGSFPIFNVGDSAVTVGVGLMILALLLDSRKHAASQGQNLDVDGNG